MGMSVNKKIYERFTMIKTPEFEAELKALCERLKIKNQSKAIREAVKGFKKEEV